VALDETGEVAVKKELTGVGSKDPKRIATLVDEIIRHIHPEDNVCIEGFSYGSKGKGVSFQYGLGYMVRDRLFRMKIPYTVVTPSAVKKFATGKGTTPKDGMVLPIFQRWDFEHPSDNVRDAFVIAQIAKELHEARRTGYIKKTPLFQHVVIKAILEPKPKTEVNKPKKTSREACGGGQSHLFKGTTVLILGRCRGELEKSNAWTALRDCL
jgi:crossover junction endodeoxyribonuclease RuvC